MKIDLPLFLSPTSGMGPFAGAYPVCTGIPFPKGLVKNGESLALLDAQGNILPCDKRPLALWHDGSWKWMELRFLAQVKPEAGTETEAGIPKGFHLTTNSIPLVKPNLKAVITDDSILVDTGAIRFTFSKSSPWPIIVDEISGHMEFKTATGILGRYHADSFAIEYSGSTTLTLVWSGRIVSAGGKSCVLKSRISVFANSGMSKAEFTLWNPKAAEHKGGLWDLGDAGSYFFHSLRLPYVFTDDGAFFFTLDPTSSEILPCGKSASLRQESSGNETWSSLVHVDRGGVPTPAFRGWRFQSEGMQLNGDKVCPALLRISGQRMIALALQNFRETFPNNFRVEGAVAYMDPFPSPWPDSTTGDFELQGGEKAEFTVWADFAADATQPQLALMAARNPVAISLPSEWHARSGAWGPIPNNLNGFDPVFKSLVQGVVDGQKAFIKRRERFEELGWRNFGEVAADHELLHYQGKREFVSHYNNQYDLVHSLLSHHAMSGDPRWFALGRDLARHVIHHDLYSTEGDKAAYNGGYFWHTAHYLHAGTATHRTYSKHADETGAIQSGFGGGPSNEHNYGSGLLLWFYLTGDTDASNAVMQLARWVRDMQNGNLTIFRFLSRNPTGLATCTREPAWQGPGRGAAFSINACLDAHSLSGEKSWLALAEDFIETCIHPADDLATMDLLNREERWSYVVFLQTLGKYLEVKSEMGETKDIHFRLARASLLKYADWMDENEYPYLDKPEQLEFPTSTWAAQELRKVCVFLLAARWARPGEGSRYRNRAVAFFDHAKNFLSQAPDAATVRNLALILGQVPLLQHVAEKPPDWELNLPFIEDAFPPKRVFTPQKIQAKINLKSILLTLGVSGLLRLIRFVANRNR